MFGFTFQIKFSLQTYMEHTGYTLFMPVPELRIFVETVGVSTVTTSGTANTPLVLMHTCSPGNLGVFNVRMWSQHTNFQSLEIADEIMITHPGKPKKSTYISHCYLIS
jgi:hypothetical protein